MNYKQQLEYDAFWILYQKKSISNTPEVFYEQFASSYNIWMNIDGTFCITTADGANKSDFDSRKSLINKNPIPISQYLSVNGDGTGDFSANGNYSSTKILYIQPPVNDIYIIKKLIVYVEDSGGMDSGLYGNGIKIDSGNGIKIKQLTGESTEVCDFMAGLSLTKNGEWSILDRDFNDSSFLSAGQGNEMYSAHLNMMKFYNNELGVVLNGSKQDRIEFQIKGNFSKLYKHNVIAMGYKK